MSAPATRAAADRNFRRGAVMGLTIAETFVLLIFCLLLLFFLWQVRQDRTDQTRADIAADPALSAEVAALVADGTFAAVRDLRDNGIDVRDLSGFAEAEDYWRFISEPELRRLLQGAVALDTPALLTLADSVAVPDLIARLDQLSAADPGPALDAFLGLSPDKQTLFLDAIDAAAPATLAALEDTAAALDPSEEARLAALLATLADNPDLLDLLATVATLPPALRAALAESPTLLTAGTDSDSLAAIQLRNINDTIVAAAQAEEALIGSLKSELGGFVAGIDGEIRADGTIVLPESAIFDQGRADIRPELRDFLSSMCPRWMRLLRDSGLDIGTAEIQGHASREWRNGTPEDAAYRNNLLLSQNRARNVLLTCLDEVTDPDLAAWARAHLVAVGYSSGRPVVIDDTVSDELSRRVEFSFGIGREGILDDIRTEMAQPPG